MMNILIKLLFFFALSFSLNAEVIFLNCEGKTEADHSVRVHTGKKDQKDFKVFDEMPVYETFPATSESYTYALDEIKNSLYENNSKYAEKNCNIETNKISCYTKRHLTHEDNFMESTHSSKIEINRINGAIEKENISITYDKQKDENDIRQYNFKGTCKKIDKKSF